MALTRSDRLDRLPFTAQHRRLLVGSGLGWALDAMDVGLISYILVVLGEQWGLTAGEKSWIVSIGFIGMAVGAALGGVLADRWGRRHVFAVTLLVFGIATGLAALSWSLWVLLVLRLVIGLGLGAELPVASTLMSEYAPARIRGRVIVFLEAFWAMGWLAAALVGFFVVPAGDNGWRWAFLLGAIPAIYAAVVRFRLPESVRFLERKGRHEEAEAAVRLFERSAGVEPPAAASTVEPDEAKPAPRATVRTLFAPAQRRTTIALWLVWFFVNFSYYGAFLWIPSILRAAGYSLVDSFGYTLVITLAQLPGYLVSGWLIEVWGRRATLATFLVGSAISALFFGTAQSAATIILFGMLLSFFNLGAWGALYAVTPEVYPTSLRGTGAGWAAGFGRIASIVAPLVVPAFLAFGGAPMLFLVFSLSFAIAAVSAFLLRELRGRPLDDA